MIAGKKNSRKKKFSYKDIKSVYTIVLFEHSPAELKKFQNKYIHRFEQTSDTGVKLELLQKYIFVTLDIFGEIQHNESDNIKIQNRLEAWLAFMSLDAPEDVITIISKYPDFKELYEQVYDICQNIEGVMDMFSKELRILDRNTVQLMIDEMQDELEQKRDELRQTNDELKQTNDELKQKSDELRQTNDELKQTSDELKQTNDELRQTNDELRQKDKELEELKKKYEQVIKENKELRG